jgi:hypothetical protein
MSAADRVPPAPDDPIVSFRAWCPSCLHVVYLSRMFFDLDAFIAGQIHDKCPRCNRRIQPYVPRRYRSAQYGW